MLNSFRNQEWRRADPIEDLLSVFFMKMRESRSRAVSEITVFSRLAFASTSEIYLEERLTRLFGSLTSFSLLKGSLKVNI